ncbi:MAG TPA: IPT/TIG domain-containing protein, partial [Solirubrobacteraceae bacterium]|nr:IPT/TIG domain-containing protein [Solirubrobacteraceae bacterium]
KVLDPTVSGISPSSGPISGGTPITITGTGFEPGTSGTTILFGGKSVAREVECSSSTECTALTPALTKNKPQTVDVRVNTQGAGGGHGKSAKNPPDDQFTFSG